MKPRYVKMTKPEKKLVKQLTAVVTRQSLLEQAQRQAVREGIGHIHLAHGYPLRDKKLGGQCRHR
jgi:hypothetical protein